MAAVAGRARAYTQNNTAHNIPMLYIIIIIDREDAVAQPLPFVRVLSAGGRPRCIGGSRQFDAVPRVSLFAHRAYGTNPKRITINHDAERQRFRNRVSIVQFENDKSAGHVREKLKIIFPAIFFLSYARFCYFCNNITVARIFEYNIIIIIIIYNMLCDTIMLFHLSVQVMAAAVVATVCTR